MDKSSEGKPQFEVQNGNGTRSKEDIFLTPPAEIMVGASDTNLLQGLQWYLEEFFKLPIVNFQSRADEVQAALKKWGSDCFNGLFGEEAKIWYHDARRNGLVNLTIKIASNNPDILSWPWEALFSESDGFIAQQCRIERELHNISDILPVAADLPTDKLNILYILSRPYGDQDVGFQTLARPLVDFAAGGKWPVQIDLLRPPTFDQLRTVLEEKRNFYHIVHFDGHGGAPLAGGQDGVLLFEKEKDPQKKGDAISADRLSTLLQEHNIPYMVLNACKSATMSSNPFASVATSLLKAGAHGVVAMSYNLWVNGAEVFVPAFYKRLFTEGDIAEAIRAGRREMYAKNIRDPLYGQKAVEFNDWVVPVLYHRTIDGKVLPKLIKGKGEKESRLPAEVRQLLRRDFIGRSGMIRQLERAFERQVQAGILVHGMAGEGKTTLAKGFLQWLEDTGGLDAGVIWFNFEGITSASYVIDVLTERLFGLQARAASQEEKIVKRLQEMPLIIVWDNFESVSGYGGVTGLLSEEDRAVLKNMLRDLRGGATKVLITSRSPETWLSAKEVFRRKLEGLQGEELWQYCNAVVSDLGLTIEQDDSEYKPLIDKLQGNPLAIRVILLRLEKKPSPKALMEELDKGEYPGEDEDTKRLLQALEVFSSGLDESFAPVLRFVGLHEQFVDAGFVENMINAIDGPTDSVAACFDMLVKAGICHEVYENGYRTHPATRASLVKLYPATDGERRAFVDFMGTLCNTCSGKQLHEQRGVFSLFSVNFHNALVIARELEMRDDICVLLYGLADYAYNNRHFIEAERLYHQLLQAGESFNRPQSQAVAYHQLGMVAEERRDFAAAETWYKQSLEVKIRQGNEHGAAITYHQLGMVAGNRRDFETAEKWYKQSLEIKLRQGNEHGAASTYHQLGMVATARRDFAAAEKLYKQSLEIELRQGNEHGAAITYGQLGIVSEERRDFDTAEKWHKQSLEIHLRHGNEHHAAITYHQLGVITTERGDFDGAEKWYKQSLEIKLRQGNEHGAAITYHQLGRIAEERGDFDAAEDFILKALEIFIRMDDPYHAEMAKRNLQRITSAKEESTQ